MKQSDPQLKLLIQTLRPMQRTLDFEEVDLWQSLPEFNRKACREAIAAVLTQLASATRELGPSNLHGDTPPEQQHTGE